MPEITPNLTDPNRCASVHWSLPVQCVMPRTHANNWHEAWHPQTGNRLRYRRTMGVFLTEDLHDGEWHDLAIPAPGVVCGEPHNERPGVFCQMEHGENGNRWNHVAVVDGCRYSWKTPLPRPVGTYQLGSDIRSLRAQVEELHAALTQAENDLTGARLSLWEEEQDSRRLRLALKSARRGRAAARERIAELEKAACGCFPAEMHDAPCAQSLFVADGVEYSAVHWYRDADGAWWIPVGGDPMRMLSTAGEEPVPLTEVISDYGPLTRTEYISGDQPEERCSRVVGDWGRCTGDWSHEGPHLYPTPTAEAGDVR